MSSSLTMPGGSTQRLPWRDRWREPGIAPLLEPQKEHHKRLFPDLVRQMGELEGLDSEMVWLGEEWKWTLRYYLPEAEGASGGGQGSRSEAVAYLIPEPEAPRLCVPLREEHIRQLPMRRLNRFIREQIRLSKCSARLFWAFFTPSQQAEVNHLINLIQRKLKMIRDTQ